MSEATPQRRDELAQQRTDLAFDRTVIAAERTLMAWVRTSLSMISFGFTLYKFFEYLREANQIAATRVHGPRHFGLVLIGLGTTALIVAAIQHRQYLARLGAKQRQFTWSLAFVVAILVALIGALTFGGMLLRVGPFEMTVYPLLAALALSLVYVLGVRLHLSGRRALISAAAGVAVAYIFVDVLPELSARQAFFLEQVVGRELLAPEYRGYLAALLGFVLFYGLEKMTLGARTEALELGHAHGDSPRIYRLHLMGFAAYSALIGYLLVERGEEGWLSLGLYSVAMALHLLVTDHALLHEHGRPYLTSGRWLLAACVLLGWAVGVLAPLPVSVMVLLFGFIAGGVVINSAKGELPEEGEGRFWPFFLGAGGYAVLMILA